MSSDCCYQPHLISFERARDLLLENAGAPLIFVSQNLNHALNGVLAENINSPIKVPSYDNSAMDGYAVRLADLKESRQLKMVGKAFAGAPFKKELKSGECVRIMTGAMIPEGADCVIKQEDTSQQGVAEINELITFRSCPEQPGNIRLAGEDIQLNETILTSGHKLKVADLGLLASLGLTHVKIFQPLKIAVFSSGDELVAPGEPLQIGQIYDSNRFTTKALLEQCGFDVIDLGILPDQPEIIRTQLQQASVDADVIITSGGVSVGEADYVKTIVEELGELSLWKVAMKPGKPFAYGKIGKAHFLGLPGNPVSSVVTLMQLGLPFLRKLQGQQFELSGYFKARLTQAIHKTPGRTDFQRAIISLNANHEWEVTPLSKQSSGVLSSMSRANGFIVLDAQTGSQPENTWVKVQRFRDIL